MGNNRAVTMLRLVILAVVIRFNNGFLLDTKNMTLPGKPVYLTAAEYYGDKNQLHQEIELQHQQQESYRAQTDKTLQLLTTQLQQQLAAMQQQIIGKNETQQQALESLALKYQQLEQKYGNLKKTHEQAYQELEQKYSILKNSQDKREQFYNELEQNFTLSQKALEEKNRICILEVGTLTNKTLILEQKIGGLEQLKSVNQLKDFQTLEQKVQTFDSRINLLSSHEQARNQDFLALYNLTTSEFRALTNKTLKRFDLIERNHNNSIIALQNAEKQKFDTLNNSITAHENEENRKFKTLNNFTSDSRSKINALEKSTSDKMDYLAQNLSMSFSALQQNIDKNNEKVVLTSCRYSGIYYNPAPKIITFPTIITAIGIKNPSSFTTTGKFTCQVPGMYHISMVISSTVDNSVIDIMKNSASVHRQNINGNTNSGGAYTPGASFVALELKTNDTVWVQTRSTTSIYDSCFTIFKI